MRFSGDFVLIKPVDAGRGNGRLLYGVNNRGNLIMLGVFSDAPWSNAPGSAADLGNGFLLDRGYTLPWSAWNRDVVRGGGRLPLLFYLSSATEYWTRAASLLHSAAAGAGRSSICAIFAVA